MKVTMVWDECNFLNGDWTDRKIRSYWVQVSHLELDRVLMHAVNPAELREEIDMNSGSDPEVCFLVSEDLESIVSLPCYYPYSGQWNGSTPFREIETRVINDLSELTP